MGLVGTLCRKYGGAMQFIEEKKFINCGENDTIY
jgi:hypothetical protein